MTDEEFSTIRKLITARNKVLWVYGNLNSSNNAPHDRTVDGLSRVLRREQTMSTFTTLALRLTETTARVEIITRVAEALTQKMDEYQLEQAYEEDEDGNICIARLKDNAKLNKNMEVLSTGPAAMLHPFGLQPLEIKIGTLGMLDTMYFTLDPIYKQPLGDNEIEIEVQAAGLNFKDCLIALGQLNENSIGLECAGTVKSIGKDTSGHGLLPGDRVCGFCHKAYRTYVRGNGAHFSRIPDSLSFAEAASIPINFATAWHSLHVVGRLQAGETILVHSGAGGTGQAAIQIARLVGATVFATVGTAEKRQLLIEKYNIPDNHIFSSRDPSFVDNIQRVTRGRGVDMVLNSTSGDMLFGSWECIAPYGRFIELGKRDIQAQKGLPMLQFERNCSFSAVDLGAMFKEKPRRVKTTLDNVLVEFNKGTLSPVYSIHQFKVSEITDAFRAMQTGKVSGKIVITMSPGDMVPVSLLNMVSEATRDG
jgi:NADPH:quinone reductase-like Zn-dependent oxidoreductase